MADNDDPMQGREWKSFENDVRRELLPKMRSSHVVISTATVGDFDVKLALEIGASVLLDKPLILILPRDQDPPPRLVRVADKIIRGDPNSTAGRQEILDALRRFLNQ